MVSQFLISILLYFNVLDIIITQYLFPHHPFIFVIKWWLLVNQFIDYASQGPQIGLRTAEIFRQ